MRSLGISQERLASRLGCTRGAIGHYLNDRRQPSLIQIERIADILNVSPAWLLYGEPKNQIQQLRPDYIKAEPLAAVQGTTMSGKTREILTYLSLSKTHPDLYALSVTGSHWSPRIMEGEAVLVDPNLEAESGDEIVINHAGNVRLLNLVRETDDQLIVSEIMKVNRRQVLDKADVRYIHTIISICCTAIVGDV